MKKSKKKLFRTRLLGFKKSDVNCYVERISKELADKAKEAEEHARLLGNKLCDAQQTIDALLKEKAVFEKSKDSISEAIIKAQENAQCIIDDAKVAAEQEKAKIKTEIIDEAERLRQLKREAADVRRQVISVAKRFGSDLSAYEKH